MLKYSTEMQNTCDRKLMYTYKNLHKFAKINLENSFITLKNDR